jgi:type II secretory pathway pseudopilin PulG
MKALLSRRSRGFTLLEALFAAMLIGLAIAALLGTSSAFTMKNAAGVDLSTAEFLIEEIREMTSAESFDSLLAYNDIPPFNPPVDLQKNQLTDFAAFTQQIQVDYVNDSNLTQTATGPTDFLRITVTILKNNRPISSASWIRARL